ncbi:hypothetical protein SDC9_62662 [bioreactor metagenome]|uniref:Uncharacterized protein n=1 Tax=bioreactor metagenome TaxID=1076179 RepID=A0A644XQB0_9ZZZZ
MVHAQFHRVLAVLFGDARGDHDDGQILQACVGADVACQVEAVHARHFDVGQHHRWTLFLQALQCLQTVGRHAHAVAFALQQTLRHAAHGDGVVDHQHQRYLRRAGRQRHACHRWRIGSRSLACGCRRQRCRLCGFLHLGAEHVGQRHRVVDQHHGTRGQHRHSRHARQARELRAQVLHHDFLVAQHFVHMQCNALCRASQNHHGADLGVHLTAVQRCLQERARPEERQAFATFLKLLRAVGRSQFLRRRAAHHFHQAGRHADGEVARAQHHHLRHRCGQWQHQTEGRSMPHRGGGFDAAAQCVHLGAHHVHSDAATGQAGHLGGRGEARHEDQVGGLDVAHRHVGGDQAALDGLLADAAHVQACTVVAELHRHVVAFLTQRDGDRAAGGLACGHAHVRAFDTVAHAVAQQVFERWRHPVQHATVHFNGAAGDVQLDLLAGFLGRLAHQRVQALGDAVELHHARAQQVALQLAGLAALVDQVVFRTFHGTLQIALHGGHVVHRLGHHAREFLHAGEAVKLQRIEARRSVLGQRQTRLHLRLGLHLDVAQLLAQTLQVAGQIVQRTAHLRHANVQTRTRNHHLARLVDQTIQQLRTHAHALARMGTRGGHLQGQRTRQRRGRCCHRRCRLRLLVRRARCGQRLRRFGLLGLRLKHRSHWCHRRQIGHCGHGDGLGQRLCAHVAQVVERLLQRVQLGEQRLDIVGVCRVLVDVLDVGLHAVGHFAQTHGTGQSCTALEGVQRTQQVAARRQVVWLHGPLAQRAAQHGQQLDRLFLEDREQIGIDHVHRVDVIGGAAAAHLRRYCGGLRLHRLRHGRSNGLLFWHRFGFGFGFGLWLGMGGKRCNHRLLHVIIRCRRGQRIGLCGLRLGQWRHAADQLGVENLVELREQLRARLLEEACRELMQQTADVFRHRREHAHLRGHAELLGLYVLQRMLQRASHLAERCEAHGGRAASQRMRTRDRRLGHRLICLLVPQLQIVDEALRPLFRLAQIDVVQRQRNQQRSDELGALIFGRLDRFCRLNRFCGGLHGLHRVLRLGLLGSSVGHLGLGRCLGGRVCGSGLEHEIGKRLRRGFGVDFVQNQRWRLLRCGLVSLVHKLGLDGVRREELAVLARQVRGHRRGFHGRCGGFVECNGVELVGGNFFGLRHVGDGWPIGLDIQRQIGQSRRLRHHRRLFLRLCTRAQGTLFQLAIQDVLRLCESSRKVEGWQFMRLEIGHQRGGFGCCFGRLGRLDNRCGLGCLRDVLERLLECREVDFLRITGLKQRLHRGRHVGRCGLQGVQLERQRGTEIQRRCIGDIESDRRFGECFGDNLGRSFDCCFGHDFRCGDNVRHSIGCSGFGDGSAQHQRHQTTFRAHGIGRDGERLGVPCAGCARSNVFHPAAKGIQRVLRQRQQIGLHRLLFGQPGVEHLLHRPGGFAEVVESDHARATLEGMECAAQRGLLAQVCRCVAQCLDGGRAVADDFARFFQEDLQQFVVFFARRRHRRRNRRLNRLHRDGDG